MPKQTALVEQAIQTVSNEGLLPAIAAIQQGVQMPHEAAAATQEVVAGAIGDGLFSKLVLHDVVAAAAITKNRRKRLGRQGLSRVH